MTKIHPEHHTLSATTNSSKPSFKNKHKSQQQTNASLSSTKRKSKTKPNPINDRLEKLPISLKLFLIVIFAFLSLIVFACILVYNSVLDLQASLVITNVSTLTTLMANLVHSSQIERAASSLYLGSNGTDYWSLVLERRSNTDQALLQFSSERERLIKELKTSSPLYIQVLKSFETVDTFIQSLSSLREKILKLQFRQPIEAINFYSNWNLAMIDTVTVVSSLSSESTFITIQSAFNTLSSMKEFTGQKRAIGSAALASHQMPLDNFLLFVQNQAKTTLLQHYLHLKDVFHIWDTFNKTVLSTNEFATSLEMEAYIVTNTNNLTQYSGSDWFGNMTQHINNMRLVEMYISDLSLDYASQLFQRSISVMIGYIVSAFSVSLISIIFALIFSKSIASPWHKIVELQRIQEMYKSFIPAHVLLQIEGNNGDDGDYVQLEEDAEPNDEEPKSPSHTSTSNASSALRTSSKHNKVDLASRFSLYLEKKKVSMIQVKIQGLSHIMNEMSPIDIVELLKDAFEKIQFSTKSTSSLMEHTDDECVTIAFNASKDQSKHEERALKTCVDLNNKLRELQNSKWKNSSKSQFSELATSRIDFKLAVHVHQSLCGNIGTADVRSFKILGPIQANLTRLTTFASQMNVRIVCDENIAKTCHSLYHIRFVGFVDFLEDDTSATKFVGARHVHEVGPPLQVCDDEWLYELAHKQKNEEWTGYNAACKEYFSGNFEKALFGFEEYTINNESDLPCKSMIELCRMQFKQKC
ncbi:hypothetical protein C9374_009006 [Naegleria lovaniensis]|uniref:Guanylate cyclase domain-containing protein n=1 Tax=Naegleria lovaniensis TaxID=51637 RepID=A0AA88KH81_NAELO|nr:uncharacterized protein C9374_009006 [Naegleria lovaniensis]KAG2377921.1 hypothetical protein C9374_009006 [Naegleria lovaniensis]